MFVLTNVETNFVIKKVYVQLRLLLIVIPAIQMAVLAQNA